MKAIITLIVIFFVLCTSINACFSVNEYYSGKLPLRQLKKVETSEKSSSGGFFVFIGGYSYSEKEDIKIQMLANTGSYYKFIEVKIKDIAIRIDNKIEIPYIQIKYYHECALSNDDIIDDFKWYSSSVIITCPEKYLPEKLLPIEL